MPRWFRSEIMSYVSLIVNEDAAHNCLADIGKMGVIQFTDLNPELTPFQRRYVSFVKRCDELERTLRFFVSECEKLDLIIESAGDIDEFLDTPLKPDDKTGSELLKNMEAELETYEAQLRELNKYNEKLITEYNAKVERQEVLQKAKQLFMSNWPRRRNSSLQRRRHSDGDEESHDLLGMGGGEDDDEDDDEDDENPRTRARNMDMRFSSITGVVSVEEKERFERMIFRATRGNCYVRFSALKQALNDPETGNLVEKCVFIVFYKSLSIEEKLDRICNAFDAHLYSLPDMDDVASVDRELTENAEEIVDSRMVLLKNQDTRFHLCEMLSKNAERWTWLVLREKTIYHSLNQFKADVSGMLRGAGWVIADRVEDVKDAVNKAHANMDMSMPSLVDYVPQPWPTAPTHFKTNKFTYGYQEFVNTYGIPRYREANPALFTAATFPFLFGVMYGDIGHGFFLFCAGLWLISQEKKHDNQKLGEMAEGMHMGRYMIVMMGFFAIYAGFVYNDCFSLGLNLFGSRWEFEGQKENEVKDNEVAYQKSAHGSPESVYPFGLDPIWHVAGNELLFFNSFKMKLSVIFGITQMFAGTCLKGANAIFFNEKLDFFFEFLPMVAFSASLFLYMVFLIVMKWCINWDSRMLSSTCIDLKGENAGSWGSAAYDGEWIKCDSEICTPWGYDCGLNGYDLGDRCPLNYGGDGDGCQPPNLITTLINIALQPGVVDEPLYGGQAMVQIVLLSIAFASVPILLLAKPYFLSLKSYSPIIHAEEDSSLIQGNDGEEHDEEHGFGEIVIHQAIETIEFVLGMVSNTASYLRLWALSLAHSELATVFWDKAMLTTLNLNWIAASMGFIVFAGVTLGVLLMMDVLECFLHALRLHWVEFQNKFYKADGVRFSPYSFRQTIKDSQA